MGANGHPAMAEVRDVPDADEIVAEALQLAADLNDRSYGIGAQVDVATCLLIALVAQRGGLDRAGRMALDRMLEHGRPRERPETEAEAEKGFWRWLGR